MSARRAVVVAWLAAGHALLFGLFWLLLRVPESNVLMLACSAAIAVSILLIAGWIEAVALLALRGETPGARAFRRGVRGMVPFLAGLLLFAAMWWVTGRLTTWWTGHRGEIDAWLMARFGWTATAWLHAGAAWLLAFLRYVVGLSLAVTLFAEAVFEPLRSLVARGLMAALSPIRLLALTILLALFFWLPWQVVYWRPSWLEPSWQELAFLAAKLGVLYMFATLGWALILERVAPRARAGTMRPAGASSE